MSAPTVEPAARLNRVRSPANAAFFTLLDGYMDRHLGGLKRRVFADLPARLVEIGPGVGANFRYLRPGTQVVAIEPNPAMHQRLRDRAQSHGVELELRGLAAGGLDLPDESIDCVISSLVLCTVEDPHQVLAEVLRVLRPGGRFAFVEHVRAPEGTALRRVQRAVRRPWAWCLEGCSCERDLQGAVEQAGFAQVVAEAHRMHTPFLPVNTLIAGVATKAW